MLQGQPTDQKPIPHHWKKRTGPIHIQAEHVFPAFNHPPDSPVLDWDFPPQESNVVQLRSA